MTVSASLFCRARWIAVALVALVGGGCGADEGVATATPDVSVSGDAQASGDLSASLDAYASPAIVLTSVGATTGPRVELDASLESDKTVTVRVLVRDFDDLYAIAAHLTWDPKALTLLEHKGHLMMLQSGYNARTLIKPSGAGRLLLGAARFREGGSPWAAIAGAKVGAEQWATLRFKLISDSAKLSFDPTHGLAKSASYEAVAMGWQHLTLQRAVNTSGGGQ